MRKTRKESFESWLKRSLREDPDLAARVEKRLAEMRIEQDLIALRQSRGLTQAQLEGRWKKPTSRGQDGGAGRQPGDQDTRPCRRGTRCPPGDSTDRGPTRIEYPHREGLRFRPLGA